MARFGFAGEASPRYIISTRVNIDGEVIIFIRWNDRWFAESFRINRFLIRIQVQ